jgi:hypothetical protein
MRRLAAIVVAAGLVWGSPGLAAAADGKPNYKNPWKPTKVASEVPDSLYQAEQNLAEQERLTEQARSLAASLEAEAAQ